MPHTRSMDESAEDVEEERRLAYVGMTRAMKELFMSYAQSRFTYGGRSYNFPSRFLQDLGFNPYGNHDVNGDGFTDDDDFGEDDFSAESDGLWTRKPGKHSFRPERDEYDPFPPDLPIYE